MQKDTIDHSHQVTRRFLLAVDAIVGDRSAGKITQQRIGEILGVNSSNINRLRTDPDRKVTIEACCRLCDHFKISATWLLLEVGEMYGNDEQYSNDKVERAVVAIEKQLEIIRKGKKKG